MARTSADQGSLREKWRVAWRGFYVQMGVTNLDDKLLDALQVGWTEGKNPLPTAALIYGLIDVHRPRSQQRRGWMSAQQSTIGRVIGVRHTKFNQQKLPSVLDLIYDEDFNRAIFARPEVLSAVLQSYQTDHKPGWWQFRLWRDYSALRKTQMTLDSMAKQFSSPTDWESGPMVALYKDLFAKIQAIQRLMSDVSKEASQDIEEEMLGMLSEFYEELEIMFKGEQSKAANKLHRWMKKMNAGGGDMLFAHLYRAMGVIDGFSKSGLSLSEIDCEDDAIESLLEPERGLLRLLCWHIDAQNKRKRAERKTE
jgi:hypothetical protein